MSSPLAALILCSLVATIYTAEDVYINAVDQPTDATTDKDTDRHVDENGVTKDQTPDGFHKSDNLVGKKGNYDSMPEFVIADTGSVSMSLLQSSSYGTSKHYRKSMRTREKSATNNGIVKRHAKHNMKVRSAFKSEKALDKENSYNIMDEYDNTQHVLNRSNETGEVAKSSNTTIPLPKPVGPQLNTNITYLHKPSHLLSDSKDEDQPEDNTCVLFVDQHSVSLFRHIVYYDELSYVYLNIVAPANVNIRGSKNIVGETIWVWTFYGREGSIDFLNWPIEFGIWSLGLLHTFVRGPLNINLKYISGDCSNIVIGERDSDLVIAKALSNTTTAMMNLDKEKYGPSFYCYKRRMFINPSILYQLCKHIVCPVEALKYSCCSYFYIGSGRQATCSYYSGQEQSFEYDPVSWVLPTVMSVFLFVFSPLLFMYISWRCTYVARNILEQRSHDQNQATILYLNETYHVTCKDTIFGGAFKVAVQYQNGLSRFIRFLIPFLSLSIIAVQIFLDNKYLHGFVITCIQKGVPMGFRSMLAGYHQSSRNFLPFVGGPFIACFIYLLITCIAITIPKSLSDVFNSGLYDSETRETIAPLRLGLRHLQKYGSVSILSRNGYHKVYSTLLAQFYMIINMKFWKFVVCLQRDRWTNWNLCRLWLALYIPLCILELIICLTLYGLPIISFGILIMRSYCGFMYNMVNQSLTFKIFVYIFTIFCIVAVSFCLFMLCTIFLDGTLFISRIITYTYTGVVVYPKESYGYLIFFFTAFYYLWECFREFSITYQRLLKLTITACESIQKQTGQAIVVTKAGFKGIRKDLFENVIESHSPRRKQMFNSFLRLLTILGILGFSLSILTKGDRFRELHIIMHVGTALFICAVPKVLKSMCSQTDERFRNTRLKNELKDTIKQYLGYFTDSEITSNSEPD